MSSAAVGELFARALRDELQGRGRTVDVVLSLSADPAERLVTRAGVIVIDGASDAGRRFLVNGAAEPLGRCVVFGVGGNRPILSLAVRQGVLGYASCQATVREIGSAVVAALDGAHYCSQELLDDLLAATVRRPERLTRQLTTASLTRRETEIAELVASGLTNVEIARDLVLQPQTVKNYVHRVIHKLGLSSRFALISSWPFLRNECREAGGDSSR